MNRKTRLLSGIDVRNTFGAEIGPSDKPLVQKDEGRVLYVDHCDTEALRKRYATESTVDISKLHVDAVWGERSLREALLESLRLRGEPCDELALDYVVASHVIEHVPDFVTWLDEVLDVLRRDERQPGSLRLAVPDRRYSFDCLRRTSDLSDIVEAYALRRRRPSAGRVLDFALLMSEVDCTKAWGGELTPASLKRGYTLDQALGLARDAEFNGAYHDVHCWVFTPQSFAALCCELAGHGLMHFECEWIDDTRRNELEFLASLKPARSAALALQSWSEAKRFLAAA